MNKKMADVNEITGGLNNLVQIFKSFKLLEWLKAGQTPIHPYTQETKLTKLDDPWL